MNATDKRALLNLTSLPTAAGREHEVIAWVKRWAKRRRWVTLREDRYGNLLLTRRGARSDRPVVLAAHLDHPAFVVEAASGRDVVARFRGGVKASYFVGSTVRHWKGARHQGAGKITAYERVGDERDPQVTIRMSPSSPTPVRPDDVLTWDLPAASVRGDHLHAPACDNLVGVFAALQALSRWNARRHRHRGKAGDLRVLLTRAEEVGFVGAVGVCRQRTVPKTADIVVLEMSKSFAESPIGAGPIVRVGDASSVFDPELTARLCAVAKRITDRNKAFRWQRRLMPGGTCEATAYQAYGYRAGCVCLPLGHYHNMNEKRGATAPESISVSDLDRMVELLTALTAAQSRPMSAPTTLRLKIDALFERQSRILG